MLPLDMARAALSLVCAMMLLPAGVSAQTPTEPQTRAELLRSQREEKQTRVEPYEQNKLEWAMHLGEERIVPLLQRDGVYARLGSITTSSGFAYGGGYRDRSLIEGRGFLDVWAAGSLTPFPWMSRKSDARATFSRGMLPPP